MRGRRCAGFTLVEVMLVITIIGVLVAVALPRLAGRTQEARLNATRLQLENLGAALDAFEYDCGRFPTTAEGLEALLSPPAGLTGWKGPYLKKRVPTDPWLHAYLYASPGVRQPDYDLSSLGADGLEGSADDVSNG